MGKKESLQAEIEIIRDRVKFFRNLLLALISGLVGVLYAFTQHKIEENIYFIILISSGIFGIIYISVLIHFSEKNRKEFVKRLEKEE